MTHLMICVHADATAASRFRSAAAERGLDVDVVPIRSPYQGMSAAYDALARACISGGRLLPGLLQRYQPPRKSYDSTWLVCWSGAYALARAMRVADRAELAGLILLDGGHTTLEADGTALDSGISWLVSWAREAKAGRTTLWIGHTDVRTYGTTASTTQVAAEVLRIAGGQGGRFLVRAYDVAKDDRSEHIAARDGWGPDFVAEAMASALLPAQHSVAGERSEEPTPVRDTPPYPLLKRGSRGPEVGAWQARLHELGFDCGMIDDAFGPLTEEATKKLQRVAGLPVTGQADRLTREAAEDAEGLTPRTPITVPPASVNRVSLSAALLAQARADLGVREERPNDGARIREYFEGTGIAPPAHWCAAALRFWLRAAGNACHAVPPITGSVGAKAFAAQLERAGRWIPATDLRREPHRLRPGMIVVWHRGAPNAPTGHVGVVATVSGAWKFTTIEANSGPKSDAVAEMSRNLTDANLLGAGRVD